MKKTYYAVNDGTALLQVVTTLGKNNLQISVGSSNLNWNKIHLSAEQTKGLIAWIKDNNVGEWE